MNEEFEAELYEGDQPKKYRYRRHILIYEGTEDEIEVPAKWEVCYRCEGEGKHTNPSIDGMGLTRADFDEQGPEFEEDYFAGVYDITCTVCGGKKLILVIDESIASDHEREAYEQMKASEAEDYQIQRMERMAEYGLEAGY